MQRTVVAAAVACAFILPAIDLSPASAEGAARPSPWDIPSKIDITYEPIDDPKKAKLRPIVERLKGQQVLERLQQFLAPLKLNRNLAVRTTDCGERSYLPYKPGGPVTMCYQFVQLIEEMAPKEGYVGLIGPIAVSQQMALVGPFVQEVLHNVALAVFDIQQVPVWGGTEFAADNVAAFLALQFGTDVALKTIVGSAYFLNRLEDRAGKKGLTVGDLADVRPTVRQRYYNMLCVAYGGDPIKFGTFRAYNRTALVTDLPDRLAGNCIEDFSTLHRAFLKTIREPHVIPELEKRVLATKWLD